MASPLKELKTIIAGTTSLSRGSIVAINSDNLVVSTSSGPVNLGYVSGYRIGDIVILNSDGSLKGRSPSTVGVPVYIV